MVIDYKRDGSGWHRWDLHLHGPGTKLANGYGDCSEENLHAYLEALEETDVQVFGITDYFSFDTYLAVSSAYESHFPDGKKLFIPNCEFRLTETVSSDGRNVHTHVLIDPALASKTKLHTLLSDLHTHKTRDRLRLRCCELATQEEYEQATVSLSDLQMALEKVFPDDTAYMIITAAGNDGLRGVDTKSARSKSISDELDKASHAFFGSDKSTDYFLGKGRYEDGTPSEKKPVFSGSDAHGMAHLVRLTGDEVGFPPTWIKADLTFRGLRQTLFEPKGRVHIGEQPTVLNRLNRDATHFIAGLHINQVEGYSGACGSWFKNVTIPFNPELTAIIGNKGSGKSAIADILGLLGESRQHEHFSFLTDETRNRKFRQKGYAENFSATLTWASGTERSKKLDADVDELRPEAVKYLPQNYFESLTNEIEVKAFRKEIEEVVFSHVEEVDRMGKSTFAELEDLKTAQSKNDISALKVRLRELNIEIIELEQQSNPSTIARLKEQLKQRREEYRVLEISKPHSVDKPEKETPEQREVSEEIEQTRALQLTVTERGKQAVERLTGIKTDIVSLGSLKESVNALDTHVKQGKEELRPVCTRFSLDIDLIVSQKISTDSIDHKASNLTAEVKVLEAEHVGEFTDQTDFDELNSVPALRKAHGYLADKLKGLQETLSAPQRRYQRYLQALSEIAEKMEEVMGNVEGPKSGTIKELESRIRYIEEDLQGQLDARYSDRDKLARSIFSAKKQVRSFYEGLKSSVEEKLKLVSSAEFDVSIDASFVPSHEFPERFLELVTQTARGPFRGAAEGRNDLDKRLAGVDWNDFETILTCAKTIISDIKTFDIDKQIKDVKRLYDFLFSLEYFEPRYELRLGGKNLNQLSPGEKGLLLLVFYLHLDKEKTPLIIDQPEDNLDNDSIFTVLARCIREAKKSRQVILVTHNPNLAVGADAEQILHVTLDKADDYKFTYESGSIENPRINDAIVKILEGSRPAFVQRRLKYQIK